MTLEQLRIFVGVAEREHVTKAAEVLNVTQSAASGAVAALEARYGVPLFHRVGRGIQLTEAGRGFLEEARAVLGRAAHAETMLADYAGLARGSLRIVASQTIASYWLPARLAAFHERHPQIAVELGIDNTEGAAAQVLSGAAELGFVEGEVNEPALAHWIVGRDPMVLVGREDVGHVDEDWLRAARWIVREQGSGTRSTFEDVLRTRGFDPTQLTVAITLPSNEAVRTAVEAGAGVAVLSRLVVARALKAGDLVELPLGLPDRAFHALRHKERYRTRAADTHSVLSGFKPLSRLDHPREMIRQFTPNWFAATMGTGILALALPQVPGIGPALKPVGEVLWFFNIALFILFAGLYGARWAMFGHEARRIFGHNTVSMFIGTIPMGLATIINGCLAFGIARFGDGIVPVAHVLWWIDVAMSLACGVLLPYLMFTRHEHSLDGMTAVWLLPVVAAEVAGASGGLLAPHLTDPHAQIVTLVTSYVLWAYSVPVAFGILAILILRMALHKLPHESMAASSWLALGPIGTGALGMLVLGADAPAILAAHGLVGVGTVAQGIGVVAGLCLWGFGLWWLALATLITVRYWRAGVPFNLGWWGYTFPLGVYTVATFRLGTTLNLGFFGIVGTVLTIALAAMWLLVGAKTLAGAWRGNLFVSPCIATPN